MRPKGHELVIGVIRDPDFGPLVMLGSGGIYLEVLKDVVFAPPPISPEDALRLIDRLKTANPEGRARTGTGRHRGAGRPRVPRCRTGAHRGREDRQKLV